MKHTLKRALALLIALLLALPTFAFADETVDENVEIEIADEDWLILSDEVEPPVGEMGEILLGDEEPEDSDDAAEPQTVDTEGLVPDEPDEPVYDAPIVPVETPAEAEPEEPAEQPAEELTEEPTEATSEEPTAFEATGASSSGMVTVSAEPGVFPAGAMLTVSDPAPARRLMKAAAPKAVQTEIVVASYAYEITMTDAEGNPIQPAEGTTATVTFQLMEAGDPNLSVRVLHETADGAVQLPAYAVDGAVVAQTTGFSKYTVEFYYNQKEYVLAGDSSVALSEILSAVGLTGEVTAVEVSDASLFSASDETGEWIVAAHQAFSTTEWMKVTINGVVYEIIVTDDSMVSVTYVRQEWNGAEVVSASVTENIPVVPADGSMTSGKYFLNSNVTVNSRVSLTGNTELILGDGYTLDVKGLYIPAGSTLIIYGQSAGTGKIYSHPSGGAAIGGYSGHDNGDIVIHGGTIDARGYDHCAGIGSNDDKTGGSITIYGGTVTAIGGSDGAAIGGGRNCSGGTITIYGGNITANGPTDSDTNENGAGIGGGRYGSGGTIVINGGNITTYSRDGAGIGGGDDGNGGSITINGGTITSTKVNNGQGARIGGGCDAAPGTIIIDGGSVTTVGGSGAGIGGGKGNTSGGSVTINGGVINASGSYGIGNGESSVSDISVTLGYTDTTKDSISITSTSYNGAVTLSKDFSKYSEDTFVEKLDSGTVENNNTLSGVTLKAYLGESNEPVSYTEYSWNESAGSLESTVITVSDYTVLTSAIITNNPDGLESGTYVVTADTTVEDYLYIRKNRTVDLIVLDGVTLTCKKGIGCGYDDDEQYATLNIFGAGTIVTTGQKLAAGIGGKDNEASGNITIHGCTITATGGEGGAGIGGGDGGQDPDGTTSIKIYAGTITATGGKYGAGIGGGDEQPGAHTYIYGGTIIATSTEKGAGIGGGDEEGTLGVFIYGGTVTAIGGEHGAGIGAGEGGGNLRKYENGGGVNIMGGTVSATGGKYGAGIGAGFYENMSGTVRITGSPKQVTIKGGSGAAGIGGGDGENNSKINYNGDMKGTVTIDCANDAGLIKISGGLLAAGIGGGFTGNMDGKVYIKGGNVEVHAGGGGAGIGGGMEVDNGAGGEGGDVYIGGGTLKIYCTTDYSDAQAIGYGTQVAPLGSDPSGSVYIASGNNKTGKYMRVCYSTDKGKTWSTAKAGDRSSKCHQDGIILLVTECNHCDYNGGSGLSYTANNDAHTAKCKYCSISFTEEHTPDASGKCTVCAYETGNGYVSFDSNGGSDVPGQSIPAGGTAARPEDPIYEGEGFSFDGWYLVTDEATGAVASEPFDFNTVITESVTLIAVWNHEHDGITFQSWNSDSSLPSSAGSYFLTKDVTLTGVWSWNGGTLNLCLAGHTVTGNIDNSSDALITVNGGTLNLFDEEDGTVTLVNARAATVAVETGGTFNLHGGTITSETNDSSLQGVDVAGTFHMSGGRITGNPTGVRVKRGGAFTVSGSARVTSNTVNVDLTLGNGKIQIGGALSDDARIGVTAQAGVFTNGLNGNGGLENFFSDNPSYDVFLSSDGEVRLGNPVAVTFDSNGGSAVDSQTVNAGEKATKPEDPTKDGFAFKGWFQVTDATTTPATLADTAFDFDTAITGDITLKAVWEEATAEGEAVLIGSTASFSGNILLNFYINFSGTLLEDEGAFVRLTFKGQNHDLPIADADYNATYKAYRFSLSLVAKEIREDVTVRVYHADGNAATFGSAGNSNYTEEGYHYSLLTYTQNRSAKSTNEDMRALARAAQDYCTAAQIYFKYNATGLSVSGDVGAVTQTQLDPYAPVTEGELPEGVSLKGITAMFESDNSLRLYLNFDGVAASSFEYKVDGKTATLGHSDNGDYLEVANVAAKRLGDKHVFSISDGTNTLTYTASVLTYARSSVINGNDARKDLGRALYLYCQAAKAYFNYPG